MNLPRYLNWVTLVDILFGIVFLTSGIFVNIVQIVLYALLNPINKHLFRKINSCLNYSLNSQLVFLLQYWANVKIILHVKKKDFDTYFGKESVLLIMNHKYEIDWLIGWVLCDSCRVLGTCKTFAKKSIQYIPTVGFAWYMGGSVFLERVWDKDKSTVARKLEDLITYQENFWILLTPEGTRFTPRKHEISKEFAKKNGLPELRHHLTPRTKGFTMALPYLRKKIGAIYDINVGVGATEENPTFKSLLQGKSLRAGLYVERYSTAEIPEDEEGQAKWLHDLFKRKDNVLDSYLETGDWFKISNVNECEKMVLPRRILPLVVFSGWSIIVLIPVGIFLAKLLFSGSPVYICIAVCIISSFTILFRKIIGETEISKGSSYGVVNHKRNK